MNLLSKLFSKKSSPKLGNEEKELMKLKWAGFEFFQKGQECYFNRQPEEGLLYLDKAFESGFISNFPTEANSIYNIRGACLQKIGYDYEAINDFDNSIALSPNDCNKYFSRSISKGAILDFEGEIADLQKAIELSKIDNTLNKEYNDEARIKGYTNGAADMFDMPLIRAKMNLDEEISEKKRIENATDSKDKLYWEELYNERREKKLSRIKRR